MSEQSILDSPTPAANTSKSKRTGIVIAFAVILALLLLLAAGLKKVQAGPLDRGMAPEISLTGYDGREFKLSDLRGQVVIVNF